MKFDMMNPNGNLEDKIRSEILKKDSNEEIVLTIYPHQRAGLHSAIRLFKMNLLKLKKNEAYYIGSVIDFKNKNYDSSFPEEFLSKYREKILSTISFLHGKDNEFILIVRYFDFSN